MKGQISRISHTPDKDFSGLYHIQGGMITDADLSEQAAVARDRTDALGNEAIRDGVPAQGGVVRLQAKGNHPSIEHVPFLRPGVVYADGLRGMVRTQEGAEWGEEKALALIAVQDGLPDAPDVPASGTHVVYADIWHRPVFALEDSRLLEVGLHGAETAFRTQTMAQLKTAPIDAAEQIESGTGAFPKKGNATLSVGALSDSDTGNPCDPCAPIIELAARLGNALFRVEVVDVKGAANAPKTVTLAWSMENASIVAPRDAPDEGFEAPDHVFEHFDRTTECHQGVFADPDDRVRSDFLEAVSSSSSRDSVRRWDGHAVFDLGAQKVDAQIGGNPADMDGTQLKVSLDHFAITIETKEKSFVAGDYWLVEIREHATQTEGEDSRIHLVSDTPLGIEHHYTCLFRIEDGKPMPLTQKERRKVSFPPLSDIPASHVSFKNNCEKLYGTDEMSAKTVQEAFDRLCDIDASDIALDVDCERFMGARTVAEGFQELCTINADTVTYDHSCPETFGNATTVGDALDKLCGISSDRTWMRYVMDWGVLCGLQVKYLAGDGVLQISPGALLTETGKFQVTPWEKPVSFKPDEILSQVFVKNPGEPVDVTFGLDVEADGTLTPVVRDWTRAFSFSERLEACEKAPDSFVFDKVIEELPKAEKQTAGKVIGLAATGAWSKGGAKLSQTELDAFERVVGKVTEAYAQTHTDDEVALLGKQLDDARATYSLNAAGDALAMQRSILAANLSGVLIRNSESLVNACKCAALWPDCPSSEALFVPLARLTGVFLPDGASPAKPDLLRSITSVCMLTQRKQAMTPRTMAYYFRELFEQSLVGIFAGQRPTAGLQDLAPVCCPVSEKDDTPVPGKKKRPFDFVGSEIAKGTIAGRVESKYIDLDNMNLEAAEIALTGNGVDVTEIIDLDDPESVDQLGALILTGSLDERLREKEKLRPGDKAVLIAKDGQAAGYLLQERGLGKYTYKPSSEKTAPREKTLSAGFTEVELAADALEKRMAALGGTADSADGRIATLNKSLAALSEDIGGSESILKEAQLAAQASVDAVKEEIDALDDTLIEREAKVEEFRAKVSSVSASTTGQLDVVTERMTTLENRAGALGDKATEQITSADKELARLTGAIAAANVTLNQMNKEIGNLQKERDGLLTNIRRERPIEALGGSFAETAQVYNRQKIFTVGDLADADDTQLRQLNAIGNLNVMRARKKEARQFLET